MEDERAHVLSLLRFAIKLMETLKSINKDALQDFKLRIGIAVGPVVAGIVGASKPQYDIWVMMDLKYCYIVTVILNFRVTLLTSLVEWRVRELLDVFRLHVKRHRLSPIMNIKASFNLNKGGRSKLREKETW